MLEVSQSYKVKKCHFKSSYHREKVSYLTSIRERLFGSMGLYLTKKIPFLNVYGDINVVGHVIKALRAHPVEGIYSLFSEQCGKSVRVTKSKKCHFKSSVFALQRES